MLKGKTEIQLTDVNTGYTQYYYDENMVTNALSDIFTLNTATSTEFLMGADSNTSGFGGSLYSTALSGILLFDSKLDEDATNYFAPADVKLVGCGVYNNETTSSDTARGIYNTTESSVSTSNKTAKYVYDFTTTQCNGSIKSVCLTSDYGGYSSYGNESLDTTISSALLYKPACVRRVTTDNYGEYVLFWDYDVDVCVTAQLTVPSSGSLTLTLRKRDAKFKNVSVFTNNSTYGEVLSSNAITVSGYYGYATNSSSGTYTPNVMYDEYANLIYFVCNTSNSTSISSSGSITLLTISPNDFSYTSSTITNNTGNILYTYYSLAVYNGYIYWMSTDRTLVYKILLSDSSVSATISDVTLSSYACSSDCFIKDGKIYVMSSKYNYQSNYPCYAVIDTELETIQYTPLRNDVSGSYTYYYTGVKSAPILGKPWLYWYGLNFNSGCCTGTFVVWSNYLATINNLSDTLTKTNSQTMKITYTITES